MSDQNPWAVENIETFSFHCCPECDFKSKDGYHFKRHALESHNKAKPFFIMAKNKKSESNTKIKCNCSKSRRALVLGLQRTLIKYMEDKMDYEYQDEIEKGMEDFVASANSVKEESLGDVRLGEHKAQTHNNSPDSVTHNLFKTFDDDESTNTFEGQELEEDFDELEYFDKTDYKNIAGYETSNDETCDGMDELEIFDEHDVENTQTFNGETFDNETEVEISEKELEEDLKIFNELESEGNPDEVKSFDEGNRNITEEKNEIKTSDKVAKNLKRKSCKNKFKSKQELGGHLSAIHEINKPHQCSLCDYRTARSSDLRKHVRRVHEKTANVKKIQCLNCEKIFTRNFTMVQHVKTHHEGKKEHHCFICRNKFTCKAGLKNHISAVHEGKKPHQCKYCDYATAYKCDLKKHVRNIHGNIIYKD